jgi:hypothetical protein
MLPDSQDAPSVRDEKLRDLFVAMPISVQLLFPEGSVIHRHVSALGAAVPETPIDEYRQPRVLEGEVRASHQREMPTPTRNSMPAE